MSVTHFEIYGEEPARLADFYRHAERGDPSSSRLLEDVSRT